MSARRAKVNPRCSHYRGALRTENPLHLGRVPTTAELTAARRAHRLAALGRARMLHVQGADADADAGDRTYLVLAKPIMNEIRLRGLAVASTNAARRKSPDNHAQAARNLRRSLRNAPLCPANSGRRFGQQIGRRVSSLPSWCARRASPTPAQPRATYTSCSSSAVAGPAVPAGAS
jgi:hypothetical protein